MKFILGFQYIILKNMKQIVSVNNFHLYVSSFYLIALIIIK
jgi:hypothetical protein